jgi:excisionase family DNA binding protein
MTASTVDGALLLRSEEAARMLGISLRKLYDLRDDGLIKFVPVGKVGVRYSVAELQRFISETETVNEVHDK